MKKLLITLMLISPFSFADWGDTYFCNTTLNFAKYHGDPLVAVGKVKTFKFNLNEANESLVFNEGSGFEDESLDVTFTRFARDGQELFYLKGDTSTAAYHNGAFGYSSTSAGGVRVITADCDKF